MKISLPSSWTLVPLSDLGKWYGGGTPSKANLAFWENGSIPWVSPKDMKVQRIRDSEDHITPEAVQSSATNAVPPGAVLIVTRSGILRHSLPVAVTDVEVTINQDLKALVPHGGIDPDYIAYALRAFESEILTKTAKGGTTVQSIELAQLLRFEVPVAPNGEQQRIVREIEKQTSRLDVAIEGLRKVQANLKKYRAAILKAACEGRLVPTEAELARVEGRGYETGEQLLRRISDERRRRWFRDQGQSRGIKRGIYDEPSMPDTSQLPDLPEGWIWARAEQICEFITKGTTPSSHDLHQGSGDIPFIKVYNLSFDGKLHFQIGPTFVGNEVHLGDLRRSVTLPGDVLMNIVGPPLGKVSIVPSEYPEWNINQAIARFRPIPGLQNGFLSRALQTPSILGWATKRAKTTAGQTNLTLEICRDLPIPTPPKVEQQRIIEEVERRLSHIEQIEATVEESLERSNALRRSILRHAFEGRLTPQNPTDELAAVLLERIREARSPVSRTAGGAMNCAPTTGRGASRSQPGRCRPEAASQNGDSALQSGIDVQETDSAPRAVVGAQFIAPPAAAMEPDSGKRLFVEQDPSSQTELAWDILFGRGLFEKEGAVREIAQGLRAKGLVHFQRLRQDGPLFNEIASTIDRSVRQGFFDRPKRGYIRAILPNPKTYSLEHWRLCLLGVLDGEPVEEEDALRAAAEWARENLGLEFARLREDGVILQGLRAALKEAVKRGEITRRRSKGARSVTVKGRIDPA